jgi:hypothetical protein
VTADCDEHGLFRRYDLDTDTWRCSFCSEVVPESPDPVVTVGRHGGRRRS